jgi:hypothetical protein
MGQKVGLFFKPAYSSAHVLVSEATIRLPIWAMQTYAQVILKSMSPLRYKNLTCLVLAHLQFYSLALMDVYPVPGYIASEPTDQAPLRYLSYQTIKLNTRFKLFEPPNLVQFTSAAFLASLSLTHPNLRPTLILLPYLHIPSPPPIEFERQNFLSPDTPNWSLEMMDIVHTTLFSLVGESVAGAWQDENLNQNYVRPKKKTVIGDGGMYI